MVLLIASLRAALSVASLLLLIQSPGELLAQPPSSNAAAKRTSTLDRIRSTHVLRWGGDGEGGAPYVFRDPNTPNRVVGFEVELADRIAAELGAKAQFRQYEWVNLVPGLQRGDFDLALNGLEVTPERRERILFSRPYYVYAEQLVVRAEEVVVDSVQACRGRRVGTLADTAAEKLLRQLGGVEVALYDGQVEPYQDLALGRLDAVLLDLPIAAYYAKPNARLKYAGPLVGEGLYAVGLRRGDERLAHEIDLAIGRLIASGELKKLYEKWQIWTAAQIKLGETPLERLGLGAAAAAPTDPAAVVTPDLPDISAASRERWSPERYLPLLLRGAWTTTYLSFISMAVAMLLGLLICVARLYAAAPLRSLALAYVEFFRGIPVLLLLFFLYYGLPYVPWIGMNLSPIAAAIIGFGLNYAAYEAEIYRAALSAVPAGQWEAAQSLGMSGPLAFRRVILPQALRIALPPITNDFVALFKDTSLVSVIAVQELTKEYLILSKSSLKYAEIGLATACLYLILSVPLAHLARRLEAKWHRL